MVVIIGVCLCLIELRYLSGRNGVRSSYDVLDFYGRRCSLVALNIFSAPAGNTVVGEFPAYQRVYLMDGSLLRDWEASQ
jgi:hypothetical protein